MKNEVIPRKSMLLVAFLCIAAAISLTTGTASSQPTAHGDAPSGRRVFYCSHSLMWDTPAPLGEDVLAYGIKDHVLVGVDRIGFSTTKQHWDQPDEQNQSKQALDTGKVDDFIMSPMELPDEGITNFVKYGLAKNPQMRFFVQNNWAAFNIDAQGWHSKGMAAWAEWINGTRQPPSKSRS